MEKELKRQEGRGEISDGFHTFNELYEHRHWLFLMLMDSHRAISWASRTHSDGSFIEDWFICGMNLPTGQISYHLPDRLWPCVEAMGLDCNEQPEYDGHTVEQVVTRLADMVKGYYPDSPLYKDSLREQNDGGE